MYVGMHLPLSPACNMLMYSAACNHQTANDNYYNQLALSLNYSHGMFGVLGWFGVSSAPQSPCFMAVMETQSVLLFSLGTHLSNL